MTTTRNLETTIDETTFDDIIQQLIGMDDIAGDYAQITFSTFDRTARCGMFALAIEDDDTETLARFLTGHCGEDEWDAHMEADRFTELWNQGRHTEAARQFATVCRVTLTAVVPLTADTREETAR